MRAAIFLILVLAIAGCVQTGEKAEQSSLDNSGLVLSIAGVENGSITELSPEKIEHLSERYPAIYGNLPEKTLYEVKTEDYLIIVDIEEKKVLKKFRVVGINLGE